MYMDIQQKNKQPQNQDQPPKLDQTTDHPGLDTSVPTNYDLNPGSSGGIVPRSMTSFEVKRSPGRL